MAYTQPASFAKPARWRHAVALALTVLCAACTGIDEAHSGFQLPVPPAGGADAPRIFDLRNHVELNELTTLLSDKRAVFIGEIHDRAQHHQNQLRIIKSLHARHPDLAIGVEYFQQPFQRYLDDYIAGRIDEKQMLARTEYYKRWQIDFRLLQPILEFARQNRIPLLALNIPEEIHGKVFNHGMKGLSAEERAQIPFELQPAGENYRQRLKAIFDSHPQGNDFENFVEGQLLWDESMADTAARYLTEHPQSRIVILAGLGHMMYGDGIPRRINLRLGDAQSMVAINGNAFGSYPGIADFLLAASDDQELPKAGKLGIAIADDAESVRIDGFSPDSPAQAAGVLAGDHIVMLDDARVSKVSDLKAQMFDKQPGQSVRILIRRPNESGYPEEIPFEIRLY